MNAAVYDRYWRSEGGGERHAGMIAQVLAEDGTDVTLLGHDRVDLARLGEHLGLDLSRCTYRRLPDRGDSALEKASERYDLFVNCTYMSRLAPRARRNAYLCFFPTPPDHDLAEWRKRAVRMLRPMLRSFRPRLEYGLGWYPPEGGHRRRFAWTNGEGVLNLTAGRETQVKMLLGRPGAPSATPLRLLTEEGACLATVPVTEKFRPYNVPVQARSDVTALHLVSDVFTPGESDTRELGVAVSRIRLGASRQALAERVAMRFPWLLKDPKELSYLDAYDLVMANSQFTRGWIQRLWQRNAEVLYPPIAVAELVPSNVREKVVLSVGRFFAPGLGHAKRQLEMVTWFGDLVRSGRLTGWRMHVVGGCEKSQLPYLRQVRAAAAGLPVTVAANATRDEVLRLYSSASIFWSATGFRDDEQARPWTNEHFGMTTVEAMSGGCVPIVVDRAGQREIVRHLVDGMRWATPRDLLSYTASVGRDESLRLRLSTAAARRSYDFSEETFAATWRKIVAQHRLLS